MQEGLTFCSTHHFVFLFWSLIMEMPVFYWVQPCLFMYVFFFSLLLYDWSKDAILTWRFSILLLILWLWPKHCSVSLKPSLLSLKKLFWKSERWTMTVSSLYFLSNNLLIKARWMRRGKVMMKRKWQKVKAQKLLFWDFFIYFLNEVYASKPGLSHPYVHRIKHRPF